LHFSPYRTIVTILWDEFADEIDPELAEGLAIELLPRLSVDSRKKAYFDIAIAYARLSFGDYTDSEQESYRASMDGGGNGTYANHYPVVRRHGEPGFGGGTELLYPARRHTYTVKAGIEVVVSGTTTLCRKV
jgi:hypothetical protein